MSIDTPTTPGAYLHLRGNNLEKGDPIALPITHSSMYHLPGAPDGPAFYGRPFNPTWAALEHALGALEGAQALAFPSGMAAITAALMAVLKSGDHLLVPSDGYYVTRVLSQTYLAKFGVTVTQRPTSHFAQGEFDGFDVVFAETPSNPGLDLIDLRAMSAAVRAAGGISIVDNTTMTPLGQRPLDLGVDMVVASDTKAPGGHSDALMGHVATRSDKLAQDVRAWRTTSGCIPGPQEAWMLHRGLETLEVRFDRMCSSAQIIAQRLADHDVPQSVRYPGLPGDPGHALAARQMLRFGSLVTFDLGSAARADAFIDACPLLRPATSFGGVHSSAERRARWGDDVPEGFVRLSVGCEPAEELWAAIDAAL